MAAHGEEDPADVYGGVACGDCDTPAGRKLSGTAGHSHDFNPCPYCDTNILNVDRSQGFDYSISYLLSLEQLLKRVKLGWKDKDDYEMLKHAFQSKNAAAPRQNTILRDYGVRWSSIDLLSDWLPSKKTVLDFMHNIFLGIGAMQILSPQMDH
jgi:hypothetical protein